jgi:hypothetical protein
MATDCPVCKELGIEPDHAPYAGPRLGDDFHGQYDPEHPEDVRVDDTMPDPHIRDVDRIEDMDGRPLIVGVDHDCLTIWAGAKTRVFTRTQTEDLARAIVAASWEAADCGGRMAAEL